MGARDDVVFGEGDGIVQRSEKVRGWNQLIFKDVGIGENVSQRRSGAGEE